MSIGTGELRILHHIDGEIAFCGHGAVKLLLTNVTLCCNIIALTGNSKDSNNNQRNTLAFGPPNAGPPHCPTDGFYQSNSFNCVGVKLLVQPSRVSVCAREIEWFTETWKRSSCPDADYSQMILLRLGLTRRRADARQVCQLVNQMTFQTKKRKKAPAWGSVWIPVFSSQTL